MDSGQRAENRKFPAEFADLKSRIPQIVVTIFVDRGQKAVGRGQRLEGRGFPQMKQIKKQIPADRFYKNWGQWTEVRGRSKLKPTTHNRQLITETLKFEL